MFSRLPADTLGAQAETASEAMIKVVNIKIYTRQDPRRGRRLEQFIHRELLTVIFTVYQSACLTIYIRHNDLIAFDELA